MPDPLGRAAPSAPSARSAPSAPVARSAPSAPVAVGEQVAVAARAMARHGLVTAFGHVSARLGDHMHITPARDLAHATAENLVLVPLDAVELPPDCPPEAWLHLAVYAARPDAHAIARGMPAAGFAAAAAVARVPVLHGQAAWLGHGIPVHQQPVLLRSPERATAAAAELTGEALLLRGNGAVTIADDPLQALARMWLVEAACRAWLDAAAAGVVRPLTDGEVEAWQAVAGQLLPRLGEHLAG